MQAIVFYVIYPLVWFLSKLPTRVVYKVSDLAYYLIFYVIKYRKDVVLDNLKIAFPEKPDNECYSIYKANMKHFCDSFIEVILSMELSKEEMRKRFKYTNLEVLEKYAQQKRPVVVMFGHQASYEWTMCLDGLTDYKIVAIYKQLHNKYFDALIRKIRKKFNSTLVPSHKARNYIQESITKGELALYGLVADQSPARYKASHFTTFFNKTSAVFMGGERIARANDTVVVFLAVEKTKRGYYKATFETITNHGAQTDEWEITDHFFKLLEAQIKKQPQYYLWTHKRWKVTTENTRKTPVLSPQVPQ
jgi:KDO2-lipid IV(A) lauroyltransferase